MRAVGVAHGTTVTFKVADRSTLRWFRIARHSPARHSLAHDNVARRRLAPPSGVVGEHRQGVTPVPIPNTEVKTLTPMILLCGKVGDRRLTGSVLRDGARLSFWTLLFGAGTPAARDRSRMGHSFPSRGGFRVRFATGPVGVVIALSDGEAIRAAIWRAAAWAVGFRGVRPALALVRARELGRRRRNSSTHGIVPRGRPQGPCPRHPSHDIRRTSHATRRTGVRRLGDWRLWMNASPRGGSSSRRIPIGIPYPPPRRTAE